jgi:hypothetical protein
MNQVEGKVRGSAKKYNPMKPMLSCKSPNNSFAPTLTVYGYT